MAAAQMCQVKEKITNFYKANEEFFFKSVKCIQRSVQTAATLFRNGISIRSSDALVTSQSRDCSQYNSALYFVRHFSVITTIFSMVTAGILLVNKTKRRI